MKINNKNEEEWTDEEIELYHRTGVVPLETKQTKMKKNKKIKVIEKDMYAFGKLEGYQTALKQFQKEIKELQEEISKEHYGMEIGLRTKEHIISLIKKRFGEMK